MRRTLCTILQQAEQDRVAVRRFSIAAVAAVVKIPRYECYFQLFFDADRTDSFGRPLEGENAGFDPVFRDLQGRISCED